MAKKYKIADVVAALKASKGMIYVAARQLGCAPNTIYNYAAKYPAVQAVIDTERGLMVDTAELALWRALQAGEAWAISLTLKTLGKKRGYIERQEVSGPHGGPLHTSSVQLYLPDNGRLAAPNVQTGASDDDRD